ncbi:MAG TPA: carbohydrate ABC transporter permease [Dermatophilaceae bacterium]|jgi:multiple sugar transport system permease protein
MPNSSARGGTTLDSDARTTAPAKPVPARGRHVPTTLTAVTAVVAVSGLVMVFPFVWEFLTSLKTLGESTSVPPVILPSRWRWDNYSRVFEAIPFAQQFLNTVVITVGRVAGQLLFCSLSAYAFARLTFRGANIIFGLFLSILMVPTQLYVIPQYQIMESLGWLNSLKALIVPGLFSAFGVFLLRQFFLALPRELEDAARTDGCNPIQTYWYVMLPLIRPGLIALGVLTTIWSWNDLLWPLIVNTDPDKMPLSAGLASLQGQRLTDFPVLMAGALLASLPMIALFTIMQRHFIASIATTGMKG